MAARPLVPIAFAAALAAAGTLAAEPPPDSAKQRLVCRAAIKTVGSRIRNPRRCRTAEQWRDEDEAKGRLPISAQVTEGQNDGRAPVQPR